MQNQSLNAVRPLVQACWDLTTSPARLAHFGVFLDYGPDTPAGFVAIFAIGGSVKETYRHARNHARRTAFVERILLS